MSGMLRWIQVRAAWICSLRVPTLGWTGVVRVAVDLENLLRVSNSCWLTSLVDVDRGAEDPDWSLRVLGPDSKVPCTGVTCTPGREEHLGETWAEMLGGAASPEGGWASNGVALHRGVGGEAERSDAHGGREGDAGVGGTGGRGAAHAGWVGALYGGQGGVRGRRVATVGRSGTVSGALPRCSPVVAAGVDDRKRLSLDVQPTSVLQRKQENLSVLRRASSTCKRETLRETSVDLEVLAHDRMTRPKHRNTCRVCNACPGSPGRWCAHRTPNRPFSLCFLSGVVGEPNRCPRRGGGAQIRVPTLLRSQVGLTWVLADLADPGMWYRTGESGHRGSYTHVLGGAASGWTHLAVRGACWAWEVGQDGGVRSRRGEDHVTRQRRRTSGSQVKAVRQLPAPATEKGENRCRLKWMPHCLHTHTHLGIHQEPYPSHTRHCPSHLTNGNTCTLANTRRLSSRTPITALLPPLSHQTHTCAHTHTHARIPAHTHAPGPRLQHGLQHRPPALAVDDGRDLLNRQLRLQRAKTRTWSVEHARPSVQNPTRDTSNKAHTEYGSKTHTHARTHIHTRACEQATHHTHTHTHTHLQEEVHRTVRQEMRHWDDPLQKLGEPCAPLLDHCRLELLPEVLFRGQHRHLPENRKWDCRNRKWDKRDPGCQELEATVRPLWEFKAPRLTPPRPPSPKNTCLRWRQAIRKSLTWPVTWILCGRRARFYVRICSWDIAPAHTWKPLSPNSRFQRRGTLHSKQACLKILTREGVEVRMVLARVPENDGWRHKHRNFIANDKTCLSVSESMHWFDHWFFMPTVHLGCPEVFTWAAVGNRPQSMLCLWGTVTPVVPQFFSCDGLWSEKSVDGGRDDALSKTCTRLEGGGALNRTGRILEDLENPMKRGGALEGRCPLRSPWNWDTTKQSARNKGGWNCTFTPSPPPPFCSFPIFSALMMKHAQPWSPASPSAQSWLLSRPWRQSSGEDATPLSNVNKTPSVTSQRHLVASSSQIRKYSRSAVELAEPGAQPHELGEATPHVRRA